MINSQVAAQDIATENSIWNSDFFVVAAETRQALVDRARDLLKAASGLEKSDHVTFGSLSLKSFQKIQSDDANASLRLGFVAVDRADLETKVQRAIKRLEDPKCNQINDINGIYFAAAPLGPDAKIAYLMPGEGSQYVGMMSDLPEALPDVQRLLGMCDQAYFVRTGSDEESATRFFRNKDQFDDQQREQLETELRRIDNAMFSVMLGDWIMFRTLESMRLRCDVVAGHSAGELAALMVTGAITGDENQFGELSGAFKNLGEHQPDDAVPSRLIALGKSSEVASEVLTGAVASAQRELQAFVAMHNCPHQSVIVGRDDDMQVVEAELLRRGMVFQQLVLEQPYHTPLFRPYMRSLRAMFNEMPFQKPSVQLYSCTTAQPFPDDPQQIRELTLAHWESPVRFTELIQNLYDSGVRCFVESGPRNNLCSFAEDILRGRDALIVPTNVPRHSGITQLNHLIARLLANHVSIDPSILFESRGLLEASIRRDEAGSFAAVVRTAEQNLSERSKEQVQGAEQIQVESQAEADTESKLLADDIGQIAVSDCTQSFEDLAMRNYLEVMDQFLDTQSQVMQSYLGRPRGRNSGRRARSVRRTRRSGSQIVDAEYHSVANAATQPELPLLGSIVEHLPGERIVTQRTMDLDEDRFSAHHTVGGRELSEVYPEQHGLPVVPMTFTLEMLCEVASTLVPGMVVIAVENISLFKWLAYEGMLSTVQVNAEVLSSEQSPEGTETRVDAQLFHWRCDESQPDMTRPAAKATIVMRHEHPAGPAPVDFDFENSRKTDVSIAQLYHNLFHGELFQGVRELTFYADNGIQGEIETLPRNKLLSSNSDPHFLFDPILLDVAMHPMCAWHLEQPDQSGRILLPIGIERIEFFGNRPAVGERFTSRAMNKKETSRQCGYDIEIIDSAGDVWCRLKSCMYWRFYLPFSEFNFHGPKNVYMLSTNWDHALPASQPDVLQRNSCRRFDVPTDLQNPTMQPVGAMVTLSDREHAEFQSLQLSAMEQTVWLFTRIAAKDAIRDLWRKLTGHRLFSADVEIDFVGHRAVATLRGRETPENFPQLAIDRAGMLFGALAFCSSSAGIAIEKVKRSGQALESYDLTDREQGLASKLQDKADQTSIWAARIHAARRAVLNATATSESNSEQRIEIVSVDSESGNMIAESGDTRSRVLVRTTAEEANVVATTFCTAE